MKVIKVTAETQHVALLEKGDRFLQLDGMQAAVVIDSDESGDIKVTVSYPNMDPDKPVPLNVVLTACVKEFLHDSDLVAKIQERLHEKQA